ncbi:hypothetical protein [Candidatus Accumulibacter vicinus]|uniref:Uncharacterized protein n=1 Tax=Candidatus Accumulibacter vicinus TaxID=2954382 RepID=A0A084XYZ6_9PROT|nr:hypothetical protein [Candidatus Accumulibacter vicinus]KFB67690.1 MAG: hypothetical protein CAPSK01_003133 [Candidatus Accumulibacter vicinus]
MAAWQFDLFFVPENGPSPVLLNDSYDVPAVSIQQAARAKSHLTACFGTPQELMKDFFAYGHEQGNRVDIMFNDDESAEVKARIDARSDSEAFVQTICALANSLGCTLFSPEFACPIESNVLAVKSALISSRSYAFVQNPKKFLSGIHNDG